MPDNKRIRRSFRAVEGDWRRADLHLHTPASADWLELGVTYLQWLQKAETKGLDIVAITDHNTVEGVARMRAEIERLAWLEANDRLRPQERRDLDEYRRLGDKILVLPGFEFTATFGFHILGIFAPETPLRKLELLLLRLNLPVDRLAEGAMDMGSTTDVLTAYRLIAEAGGIVIAAHANSTHGVALQGMSFGGQTRIAFTQDPNLHALEVTDMESVSRRASAHFFDGSKPEYPRRMQLIQGSDAHRLTRDPRDKNRLGVGDRVTEILLPEVTYEALRAVLEGDDFTRMRPYRPPAEVPFDHVLAALDQGANIIQSFHEGLSRADGRLQKVLCDVVAFANTSGGTIYVGVAPGAKAVARGVAEPELEVLQLKKEIERNITPPLEATVDVLMSMGAPVLRVRVPSGADKPYTLGQTRVYVREEGETNEAVRDELVQLVLSGQRHLQIEQPASPSERAPESLELEPIAPLGMRDLTAPPMVAAASVPLPSTDTVRLPAIGVEIASMEERKGNRYFAIRDLRNGNVVQNVTIHSARKLWSYAINQHLTTPVESSRVTWRGELGLLQAARRAKKLRYDLVLRQPDGSLRVFYGVTADGMGGPWSQFLLAEDRPEGETSAVVPSSAIIDFPEDEPVMETAQEEDILAPADEENGAVEAKDAAAPSRRRRRGGRGRGRGRGVPGAEAEAPEAPLPGVVPEPGTARTQADGGNGRPEPVLIPPAVRATPMLPDGELGAIAEPKKPTRTRRARTPSTSLPGAVDTSQDQVGMPVPAPKVDSTLQVPVVTAPSLDSSPAAPKSRARTRTPKSKDATVSAVTATTQPEPQPAAAAAVTKPSRRRTTKTPEAEPVQLAPEAAAPAPSKPRTRRKKTTEV